MVELIWYNNKTELKYDGRVWSGLAVGGFQRRALVIKI